MDMETYRNTAEVNLFGVINGLKVFLPKIRKRQDLENEEFTSCLAHMMRA